MINERIYNRVVLCFLNDLVGIPQTRKEIVEHLAGRIRKPCEAQVDRALSVLETLEYVRRCEPTADDEPMYKITDKGMRQAGRKVPLSELDPLIWEATRL